MASAIRARQRDGTPSILHSPAIKQLVNTPPRSVPVPDPPASLQEPGRKWRVALYSHDAMGLGHIRRNLLVAKALAAPPLNATVLMVAGAGEAASFDAPSGVDFLTLPALRKAGNGHYEPRALDIAYDEIIALRSGILQAGLEAFRPDVFIVDKVPRGVGHELDATLENLRARGHTRCVLGLRDVLDSPETVRREWTRDGNDDTIRRYYDAVWVYGDPEVYDMMAEYGLSPDIARKVRYTGYLDHTLYSQAGPSACGEVLAPLRLPAGRLMVCMVGGGEDGERLAHTFALAPMPAGATGVVVTGPFMPAGARNRLHAIAADRPRLRVVEFVAGAERLLACADRVVAMGGYNTTGELLSLGKPALIVPRVHPRQEQWIRAQRLSALGLLDVLHPDELSPRAIGDWLASDVPAPESARRKLDLNGLSRLPRFFEELTALAPFTLFGEYNEGGGWCAAY